MPDSGLQKDLENGERVTYTMIHNRILTPKCLNCHGPWDVDNLSTYESLVTYVNPGDHANSKLFKVINNNFMPKEGAPLTPVEKQAIIKWINEGALND